MVSEDHENELKFAQGVFQSETFYKHVGDHTFSKFFSIERPPKLMTELIEISDNPEGSIPDLLMLAHNQPPINLEVSYPTIPTRILVLWIEAVKSSLRGFPSEKDAIEALYKTLRLRDLFDSTTLQLGPMGKNAKINQLLHDQFLLEMTRIHVNFYIVRGEKIWECKELW